MMHQVYGTRSQIIAPEEYLFSSFEDLQYCSKADKVSESSLEAQSACLVQKAKRTKLHIVEIVKHDSAEDVLLVQLLIDAKKQNLKEKKIVLKTVTWCNLVLKYLPAFVI